MKILLVDDEPDIIEFLSYNLKKEGFEVLAATNGLEAIKVAKVELPDIIIMDIMMPVLDGVSACRKMREIPLLQNKIIIILTARGEEYSEVAGFEAGADDYIAKPVKIRVLIARINSLKNRISKGQHTEDEGELELGEFRISQEERMVYKSGEKIQLPKKEFEILSLLSSRPGKIFTREQIYINLWGSDSVVSERTLDVHIRKLRENIGVEHIKTSKGVGYAFVIEEKIMKNYSPQSLSFVSSLAVAILCLVLLVLVKINQDQAVVWWALALVPVVVFFSSYFVIQYTVSKFIHERIKLIYRMISEFRSAKSSSDFKIDIEQDVISSVEGEVYRWTQHKRKEIKEQKKQEEYRKEFVNNVSHELKTPIFSIEGYI